MSQTLTAGITRDRAFELLNEHNKDPFHITHGETVEGTMRYFAREFDPENEEFWGIVGLLHDLDWEEHDDEPELHTIYAAKDIEAAGGTPELIRAINSALFALRERQSLRRQQEENRSLLARQYAGITDILRQLGAEVTQDVTAQPMMEKQIRRYAAAFGWIDRVCAVRDAQGRLIVELYGDGIADILRQGEGFSAGLSALLDVALTEPREMENEFGTCLEMHERAPFRAVVGIGRQQRSGVSVSGDSGCWFLTDAGVACLLLADGMGSGAAAAQDSRMLVSSMERFLRAGIPLGDALGAVSPALRLRSDGTRFVTLDALTLDLFTGQAESLKCGAAPSYVRTDGRWSVLAGKSLPVGLSDEKNQSQSVPLRLSHGDLFIMVSDGVSDGLDDAWVRELLREHGGEGPKELAARLVTEARGRGSDDDRTAIVMRVEKTQF